MIDEKQLISIIPSIINLCPKKFAQFVKDNYGINLSMNGCGPSGWKFLIPDFTKKNTKICNWHDICYDYEAYYLATIVMKTNKLTKFYGKFTKWFGKDSGKISSGDILLYDHLLLFSEDR